MDNKIILYHGSEKIIENPIFGAGKKNNDFGFGFYCTESNDLAKEWAVSSLNDGYSNKYTLDTEYLKILNLNSSDYTILNWIAILVEHRLFSIKTPVARRANQYYLKMLDQEMDGLFIQDIIRGGITNDDPCIPRNICK